LAYSSADNKIHTMQIQLLTGAWTEWSKLVRPKSAKSH